MKAVDTLELTADRVKYLMSRMTEDMKLRIPVRVTFANWSWVELDFRTGEYYTAPEIRHWNWSFDPSRQIRANIEQCFAAGITSAHNLDLINGTSFLTKLKLLFTVNKEDTKSSLIMELLFSYRAFQKRFANEVEFQMQFYQLAMKRLAVCKPR